MAQRAIREFDAKRMMARALGRFSQGRFSLDPRMVLVGPETDLDRLDELHPWLRATRLVAKPDQLFGKRGKNGLVLADATWEQARDWIAARRGREVTITQTTGTTTGTLTHFLLEPFVPHAPGNEYYVAITAQRDGDRILFSTRGGVDIEEVWDTVVETRVGVLDPIEELRVALPDDLEEKALVEAFVRALYLLFRDHHFTFLELNPFVVGWDGRVIPLDAKARLDDYAAFDCCERWSVPCGEGPRSPLIFPKAFGMHVSPEEARVEELDSRTGASLKLTVLNPEGRIWNLVAGGGASVIYADTVCDLGLAGELANYGEYSGDPSAEDTADYTRVVLDLMTRAPAPDGKPKYLLVGGGIANFTDVASTFTGIVQAVEEYADRLKAVDARIFVRRGGPNYEAGLARMRRLGEMLGLPVRVYGPETHMTAIVRMAAEER